MLEIFLKKNVVDIFFTLTWQLQHAVGRPPDDGFLHDDAEGKHVRRLGRLPLARVVPEQFGRLPQQLWGRNVAIYYDCND